jgi:hypothetical protein
MHAEHYNHSREDQHVEDKEKCKHKATRCINCHDQDRVDNNLQFPFALTASSEIKCRFQLKPPVDCRCLSRETDSIASVHLELE